MLSKLGLLDLHRQNYAGAARKFGIVLGARPGDDDVRRRAARALGRLGPRAERATPVLVEALGDPNGHVRTEAATALGRIGSRDPEVVVALAVATRDEGNLVRHAAAVALGRLGAPESAGEALEALLEDEDGQVREAARRALQRPDTDPGPGPD